MERERRVIGICGRKVCIDATQAKIRKSGDLAQEVESLVPIDASTTHPGIDLYVNSSGVPGLQTCRGKLASELHGWQRWLETMGDGFGNLALQQRREHPDVGLYPLGPELNPLVECRYAKMPDPLANGRPRHLDGAMTIGIRFDDEQDITLGSNVVLDVLKIFVESIEIDFEPG